MRKEMFKLLKAQYINKLVEDNQGFRHESAKYQAKKEFVLHMGMATEKELEEMESDLEVEYRIAKSEAK